MIVCAVNAGASLFDIPHRFSAQVLWVPKFEKGNKLLSQVVNGWQLATILTKQSGRPFSVWNGAASTAGGDYNRDGGGGAVGGGFYDRPNAPAAGAITTSFDKQAFLSGLFPANIFPHQRLEPLERWTEYISWTEICYD